MQADDLVWMSRALELAKQAEAVGEVPVGAVLVLENKIIGEGYNQPISQQDPTAHAEIKAMRNAATALQNYRLLNTTLYVTLEPCAMCAGAMVHARIARVVYGAYDKKAGAIISKLQLLDQPFLNHRVQHTGGIMEPQCSTLLSEFFQRRR